MFQVLIAQRQSVFKSRNQEFWNQDESGWQLFAAESQKGESFKNFLDSGQEQYILAFCRVICILSVLTVEDIPTLPGRALTS